jgi:hypothetical protein
MAASNPNPRKLLTILTLVELPCVIIGALLMTQFHQRELGIGVLLLGGFVPSLVVMLTTARKGPSQPKDTDEDTRL